MAYHVLPIDDIKPHEESSTCPCCPKVEILESNGEMVIIHNSFDGRELKDNEKWLKDIEE